MFHLHLGSSWSLSSPSDLQQRVQPIIDVHAVYDAMQEIVRLNAIEQLCENVTHAEEHTPDDQEQFHHRIHRDVLIPRSITMYSPFLPLPFHSLLLQVVIGHVTSSRAPSVAAPLDDVPSSLRSTGLHRLRLAVLALASQHNFAQAHCGLFCCGLRRLLRNLLHDVLILSHSSLTQRRNLCTCREH